MVLNTASVGAAVAPVVFQTFITHYFQRGPRREKPTAHISYDEGLNLIRKFLVYASHHTVEDIQRFTSQWVPHPPYVKVDEDRIPDIYLKEAATHLINQLGMYGGIERVGGEKWWQWRRPGSDLKAEWIETRTDYQERTKNGRESKRVMLYVHGGAYFFGSTDEHRYQMQRHARKLKARVFAPRYRLAPQFPFPCGIYDCLAAYLYLLSVQDPTTIVLAGDSAGGGMVLSMLVIMRDRGIPLPAGAILISPWVDLTHSFPSVGEENPLDYIPAHGFHQRPSPAWPPPNADEIRALEGGLVNDLAKSKGSTLSRQAETDAAQGFHVDNHPPPGTQNNTAAAGHSSNNVPEPEANTIPGSGRDLSIMIDGKLVVIKDQIQMYATNELISHPLVSPVLQPSLGGLPPLLVLTGGGEMLRDEQIYIAHKAANPTKYPPGDVFLDRYPHDQSPRSIIDKWKPTDVQLQVWDDLCHVPPTLSFTRPAKYMYRSIAQFGAWALAQAQETEIEILDDDDVSVISRSSESGEDIKKKTPCESAEQVAEQVGKAGDPLPPFNDHMIRQRIDRHGTIFPLAPESELRACKMSPDDIGVIKPEPVKKWMAAKEIWDTKYSTQKRKVQKQRAKELAKGYEKFGTDVPPPSALAGRRIIGAGIEKENQTKKSWGMSMWGGWGSKHDELTINREARADKAGKRIGTTIASAGIGNGARDLGARYADGKGTLDDETSGETNQSSPLPTIAASLGKSFPKDMDGATAESLQPVSHPSAPDTFASAVNEGGLNIPEVLIKMPTIERDNEEGVVKYNSQGEEMRRPTAGGIAFPFAMAMGGEGADGVMKGGVRERNASIGAAGREASASMESLVSVNSALPDGYEWQFDDKEGYVQVEKEDRKGKGKGKENKHLSLEAESGAEASAVESGSEGLSEHEGQGGLGVLDQVNRDVAGKGKEISAGVDTDTDVPTDLKSISPCLSAVGIQTRPPPNERFYTAQELLK
ncbi:hypothetical protein DSL72_007072 [Monilinia vaccinii-corymbosi]|uniref:Alpha/beta hydrolase fold-3 domain-containing protein n=1 Tax=Monilinia vaccinii-corymbosi TaxID=61207 RepID=A0A8A3PLE8_9HELO|nr:hypothetical protein DSL72_007072 [Monilinia vaccinii-corymbosi]